MSLVIAGDATAKRQRIAKILGIVALAEARAVQEILPWMNVRPGSLLRAAKLWKHFHRPRTEAGLIGSNCLSQNDSPQISEGIFFFKLKLHLLVRYKYEVSNY